MKTELNDRVALVTGGTKGIGRAIVQTLIEEGAQVAVTARGEDGLKNLANDFPGKNILTLIADATDQAEIKVAVENVIDTFGKLDILVNNVGGAVRMGGLNDLTDVDWKNAFDLNVMSLVHFVKAADPHLRKSNCGRIINISSISGVQPGTFNPHYTITKAAIINLSKYLANYFVEDDILVNVVCPGPVYSESWEENVRRQATELDISLEDARQRIEQEESLKIPLGRVGEGADIAGLVAFLASDKASWITGSCFHINGGKLKTIY
jgi:3-oxoacyl-[acyl-carrier protein] reductase